MLYHHMDIRVWNANMRDMHHRNVTAALRNGVAGFVVGALVRDRKTGLRAGVGLALATAFARVTGHDHEDAQFIEVVDEHGER